jgi:hypothetical protein
VGYPALAHLPQNPPVASLQRGLRNLPPLPTNTLPESDGLRTASTPSQSEPRYETVRTSGARRDAAYPRTGQSGGRTQRRHGLALPKEELLTSKVWLLLVSRTSPPFLKVQADEGPSLRESPRPRGTGRSSRRPGAAARGPLRAPRRSSPSTRRCGSTPRCCSRRRRYRAAR